MTLAERDHAEACASAAITALATAGTVLLRARQWSPEQGMELIDALREDIKQLIGDVEALQQIIHQG